MNLLDFRKNIFSQEGEDGVIEKIFDVLGIKNGTCVEFGAWDGINISNTANLVLNHSWRGIFIEKDSERFKCLSDNYSKNPNTVLINRKLELDGENRIDNVIPDSVSFDFDLLSIDVDGPDYWIWESMSKFVPKVVVVEFNPTCHPGLHWVQERSVDVQQGASLLALSDLANRKGYKLVCAMPYNGIFVRNQYCSLFGIADHSIESMWPFRDKLTYLIIGYDGTVHLAGNKHLIWHNYELDESVLQVVPISERKFG